ncbi:MAG: cyclic nucleotide-binding domain-containing protein [Anaerolineales bacterium]|nr:MAG: cyclic nucleotide-binding domain-containing protein [Anaerolineales bacterium]
MSIEIPARVAFLKKIHLFYGLEDDALVNIAEELDEQSYPKDSVVVKQDSPADSFYMIYDGSVRIVRSQDGKEIQLARLVKDDYFGEMGLISNRRRSATVTALDDTSLLILSRDDFKKLFREHPDLKYNLDVALRSRQLARQLRFKWLRPDEVIYFLARKHWVALYPKILAPLGLLVIPILFGYSYFRILTHSIVATAALGSLFAALVWLGWLLLDWSNDYYVVTNQRVVWLEKVIGIYDSRQESPLSMIVSVGVEVNQFGRFLDFGNVIVRTFVGRIDFAIVNHPTQAAKMVEEYWQRTKQAAVATEKEAMKDAIRSRLGIPVPPKPEPASPQPTTSVPRRSGAAFLKLLGSNTLKLRYETGDSVIYRKHWVVLLLNSWMPLAGVFASFGLFLSRLYQLYFDQDNAFISLVNGLNVDVWALLTLGIMALFVGWFLYRFVDWSNDVFEVNADQIIDIDRTPFGTETRNAAQLENILGTKYERRGLLGNLFNFGHVYITVGGNKLVFEDVIDPANVQSDIDRRRDARVVKKNQAVAAADRERMADWLVTYHDNAEEFKKQQEENKRNQQNGSA